MHAGATSRLSRIGATSPAAPPVLYNPLFVTLGDSKVGFAQPATRWQSGSGHNIRCNAQTAATFLPFYTGNKLQPALPYNFGISSQTNDQCSELGQRVSDDIIGGGLYRMDLRAVAQNEANTVIIWTGDNDTPANINGVGRAAMRRIIDYLTDGRNCFRGWPKCIVLLNEQAKGIATDGSTGSDYTTPRQLWDYTRWCMTFDYRQPGGNPRVIAPDNYALAVNQTTVPDSYPDRPAGYTAASGTANASPNTAGVVLLNKRGVNVDLVHPQPAHNAAVASLIASELAASITAAGFTDTITPLLPSSGTPASPGTAAVAGCLNLNPFLISSGGTLNTITHNTGFLRYDNGTADTAGVIPVNWTLQPLSGTTVPTQGLARISGTFGFDPDGYPEWIFTCSWSGCQSDMNTIMQCFNRPTAAAATSQGYVLGNKLQTVGRVGLDAGSTNAYGIGISCEPQTTPASAQTKTFWRYPPALTSSGLLIRPANVNNGSTITGMTDTGFGRETMATPVIDTENFRTLGGVQASSNPFQFGFFFGIGGASGSAVYRVGRMGMRFIA